MEVNKILTADILDILFEGRNKQYGAYELRNTYDKRVITAMGITAFVVIIFATAVIENSANTSNSIEVPVITFDPVNITPDEKIIPPPPKQIKQQPMRTIAFVPPIIVKNDLVIEPPAENNDLVDVRINTKSIEGKIDNTIAPPEEIKNSQVLKTPVKKQSREDDILIDVQIDAKFNGNWNAYVKKEIEKNIDELTEAGESGTCIVKFVVSKDGTVSNVEAITMKGTKLAEIAVNVIRKGPKWIPAQQNGTIVNAYRQQPITFKINE